MTCEKMLLSYICNLWLPSQFTYCCCSVCLLCTKAMIRFNWMYRTLSLWYNFPATLWFLITILQTASSDHHNAWWESTDANRNYQQVIDLLYLLYLVSSYLRFHSWDTNVWSLVTTLIHFLKYICKDTKDATQLPMLYRTCNLLHT